MKQAEEEKNVEGNHVEEKRKVKEEEEKEDVQRKNVEGENKMISIYIKWVD